ncbi:hypothetical protein ACVMIX_006638 [Rhizobium leguminosarum]
MKEFSRYFLDNIGSCMGCMRQSFQMATISWTATSAVLVFDHGLVGHIGILVSLGLSLLWVTHLLAFAARNSAAVDAGATAMPVPVDVFLGHLAFAAVETAVLYRPGLKDRFGSPLFGRRFLVELKNPDGSRTAYRKNPDDVDALVQELKLRGFAGEIINPEYWMSNDSCERSAAKLCSTHTCDDSSKKCKSGGAVGMGACKCQ